MDRPEPPQEVGKYGRTMGTVRQNVVRYRGRLMNRWTAKRMYDRDLAKWKEEVPNG